MEQLIPTLEDLLWALRPAFRQEVYHMFGLMVVAWIVCLGTADHQPSLGNHRADRPTKPCGGLSAV